MMIINLIQEMKRLSIINRTPVYVPRTTVETETVEQEFNNPYPEVVSKLKSGDLELPEPNQLPTKKDIQDLTAKAKIAVSGMSSTNNNRKAIEALAEAVERIT